MVTNLTFRTLLATTAVAGLTLSAPAYAGGVSAGTLIENTASATYDDGEGPKTVDSNTVIDRCFPLRLRAGRPSPML